MEIFRPICTPALHTAHCEALLLHNASIGVKVGSDTFVKRHPGTFADAKEAAVWTAKEAIMLLQSPSPAYTIS